MVDVSYAMMTEQMKFCVATCLGMKEDRESMLKAVHEGQERHRSTNDSHEFLVSQRVRRFLALHAVGATSHRAPSLASETVREVVSGRAPVSASSLVATKTAASWRSQRPDGDVWSPQTQVQIGAVLEFGKYSSYAASTRL